MNDLLNSLVRDMQAVQQGSLAHTPLYHQLYSILKRAILDGNIIYDSKMPTELQLATSFKVSRITARRAMDELASEKLISRSRGKGSYVTYQFSANPVRGLLEGMLESLIDMSVHSIIKVVSIEIIKPPVEIRDLLNLSEDETVHKVIRVSSNGENEPYVYYESWTSGISKNYTKALLESTPRVKLMLENGLRLTECKQVISAVSAAGQIALELDVNLGAALLSVRRLGRNSDGEVVDIIDGFYNPKRYQYAMVMSID